MAKKKPQQPLTPEQPNPTFDEKASAAAQEFSKEMLAAFPELRGIGVVFNWKIEDPDRLPTGTCNPGASIPINLSTMLMAAGRYTAAVAGLLEQATQLKRDADAMLPPPPQER